MELIVANATEEEAQSFIVEFRRIWTDYLSDGVLVVGGLNNHPEPFADGTFCDNGTYRVAPEHPFPQLRAKPGLRASWEVLPAIAGETIGQPFEYTDTANLHHYLQLQVNQTGNLTYPLAGYPLDNVVAKHFDGRADRGNGYIGSVITEGAECG